MNDATHMRSIVTKCISPIRYLLARSTGGRDDDIRGVVAIEFAIVALILVVMMICTVDLGMGFYRKMQVQNAAQAGAQYAAMQGFTETSISGAVRAATSFAGISASPLPKQFCGCPANTGVTSIVCSSTCSGGSAPGTYVSVSAQGTYTTILSYPLIPNSFTLSSQSTVRIQ
jgi:Flp pilus assembly protein TadG